MQDLVLGNENLAGWMIDMSLVLPAGISLTVGNNLVFYGDIEDSVEAKAQTGM